MSTTVERLQVEVSARTAAARAELAKMDASTSRTVSSGSKGMGRLARSMGLAFGGAAIVGGITKTIGLAMDFDKTMRQVGVNAGVSGKQLSHMGDLAKQMGAATIFSAQDAAQAMLELSKGGLNAAQIKTGALKQTLTLAAAGGIDLADSAGVMANAMNMFGVKAKDASQVTTALAGAANASTASVDSLRMGLSQVGSGARGAGLNIQTTVAALAEFDNAGIKGSDAGTSLKTMLQRLVPQTKKATDAMEKYNLSFSDSHGNFKSLGAIAQSLKDHLGKLSQVQRTQALNTIFGSDASRAAAVLMRGGRQEVEKYTKAAKDQHAAQKMANTAMQGASGAWENFKGTVETLAISMGQKLLPTVEDMLNKGNDLLNSANQWGPGVAKDFEGIWHAAEGTVRAIQPLAQIALQLAKGFQALPGPIKQTAIEVGLAALVWPRLQAAAVGALTPIGAGITSTRAKLAQFRAEMTYSATRGQALAGALRGVAGPAGMGLMIASSQTGSAKLKAFGQVAGGALMGFSVGGPIGAAIGGSVGLMGALSSATHGASSELKAMAAQASAARGAQLDLRSSLDQTTGAMTAQARQQVSQDIYNQHLTQSANALGITSRDLVSAILGQEGAYKRVNKAVRDSINLGGANATSQQNALSDAATNIGAYLDGASRKFRKTRDEIRNVNAGTVNWGKALRGLPKNVQPRVKALGAKPALEDVARLTKAYHLTPKQVKTVLKATGAGFTVKQVENVKDKVSDLNRTKVDMKSYTTSVSRAMGQASDAANEGGKTVRLKAEREPKAAKANLSAYVQSVRVGGSTAAGVASTGGHSVGEALKSGVLGGFAGTESALASAAASAVRGAIASAKAAAKIKSPSRRMRDEVGKQLGKGVEKGIKDRHRALVQSGRDMIRNVMDGIRQSRGDALRSLKGLGKWAAKHFSGAQEDRWAVRVKRASRAVAGDYERLKNVTDRLSKAQDRLTSRRARRNDFMASISGGMTAQASVTNAGADAGSIATNLATQAAKVKEFAHMLTQLRKRGWADQIIRDIAAAGVEGGYDTAKALLSASAQEEASINQSYKAIYKTAKQTAKSMGDAMYGAGIKAAEGAVAGLKKKQRAIKDALLAIAASMADAIRAAIGIKGGKGGRHTGGGNDGGGRPHHHAGGGGGAGSGAPGARIRRRDTVAARAVGGGGSVHFHFKTYNPREEPQSKTTNKALQRAVALGLV